MRLLDKCCYIITAPGFWSWQNKSVQGLKVKIKRSLVIRSCSVSVLEHIKIREQIICWRNIILKNKNVYSGLYGLSKGLRSINIPLSKKYLQFPFQFPAGEVVVVGFAAVVVVVVVIDPFVWAQQYLLVTT